MDEDGSERSMDEEGASLEGRWVVSQMKKRQVNRVTLAAAS
jgi:hypothetical protein